MCSVDSWTCRVQGMHAGQYYKDVAIGERFSWWNCSTELSGGIVDWKIQYFLVYMETRQEKIYLSNQPLIDNPELQFCSDSYIPLDYCSACIFEPCLFNGRRYTFVSFAWKWIFLIRIWIPLTTCKRTFSK